MKYILPIVIIILLVNGQRNQENCILQNVCEEGTMKTSWYFFETDTLLMPKRKLEAKFQILVDTTRSSAQTIVTKTAQQQPSIYFFSFEKDTTQAPKNNSALRVWLINNTKDTVPILMQAWSIICIQEAKNSCQEWKPVEYFEGSPGAIFYYENIPPQGVNSFLANRFTGNERVEMRFKLLAQGKFYYSNSFWGTIDACTFQINTKDTRFKYTLEKALVL